ncbi:MAG TPA: hypothetical protein VMT91_07020 [Anaerolineales bacterium]|nr:hypothetical protein [Anaerolineales bacterium]
MLEAVFINCIAEDLPIAEGLMERLQLAGVACFIQPARVDPLIQVELVEKIKAIAAAHGCMVNILSNQAVSNSQFISNIQLMCEVARKEKVLVNYLMERLENDAQIRLFSSQASQVKRTARPSEDITRVIRQINRTLHPPAGNLAQLLAGIISRKALTALAIIIIALAAVASAVFNLVRNSSAAPALPTPTPVVIYAPFSEQSQDAGLTVDSRFVPGYRPVGDPAAAAPFSFKPKTILDQEDFSDPVFENTFDGQKWNLNHFMLNDVSSLAVTQTNGVMQMAVAPVGNRVVSLNLESKYLFNPQQVTYLGFRFRLNDYPGKVQENTVFQAAFPYGDITLDGISQRLTGEKKINLGSSWHTLELLSQADRHLVNVYLDGAKIKILTIDDESLIQWTHCGFNMEAANTTDWVRIQIDEIIWGADQALPEALQPENAPYHFVPDSVDVHENFKTLPAQPILAQGAQYVSLTNNGISFNFPAGTSDETIRLEFPGKPIDVDNYYAARFRFTSPDDNVWSEWADLIIGLENKRFQAPAGFDLQFGTLRQEYNFKGSYGPNTEINAFAKNQSAQPGVWHTLEMVIQSPTANSQQYTFIYWVDGYRLGKGSSQNMAEFLDKNAPLSAFIQIDSGSYRQNAFSGEIEDLVIGTLANDKIQE